MKVCITFLNKVMLSVVFKLWGVNFFESSTKFQKSLNKLIAELVHIMQVDYVI